MKKLSLKKLKLESNDLLQRNDLKTVIGGYGSSGGSGSCYYRCSRKKLEGGVTTYFNGNTSAAAAYQWEQIWQGFGYMTLCLN